MNTTGRKKCHEQGIAFPWHYQTGLKSLYPDETSWTSAVVPLMNTLRQDRRDAVLSYLLSNSVKNPFSFGNPGNRFSVFPDEFAVYGNFLIDTEMAACQPTTRIIQGYCSIQLFVQRCLMNSEAPLIEVNTDAITGDPDWLQWDWMGTAESWYEARYTATDEDKKTQTQKAQGNSKGDISASSPPPAKYWQIQMDNAYLLDPARGYPTAINLSNIVHYDAQISRLWFAGSEFDSMLPEGNIPLEDNKGHNILSSPLSLKYANALSMQMGLWAKYR